MPGASGGYCGGTVQSDLCSAGIADYFMIVLDVMVPSVGSLDIEATAVAATGAEVSLWTIGA